MTDWQRTIADVLMRMSQRQRPSPVAEIRPEQDLERDLALSSMDFAQLMLTLADELGVDPFDGDVDIADIHTVRDLYDAYVKYFG